MCEAVLLIKWTLVRLMYPVEYIAPPDDTPEAVLLMNFVFLIINEPLEVIAPNR